MAVIVIGGTSGVGRELVLSLLTSGRKVIVGGRNFKDLEIALKDYSLDQCRMIFIDLNDQSTYEDFWSKAVMSFSSIDTLVMYAGSTSQGGFYECGTRAAHDLTEIIRINLMSAVYLCGKYVDYCTNNRLNGHVIFTGTGHMYAGEIDRLYYALSKGGLLTLMRHIVRNYSEKGIRANMVLMGWTLTEGELRLRSSIGFDFDNAQSLVENSIPLTKTFIPISDLVEAYMFLCNTAPRTLTNTILNVNGGERI